MRLVVLQHCPVTPIGLVGEVAEARGAQINTVFPHHGDAVPGVDDLDGLVVLGGPMHAADDVGYPAFAGILALIRRCHAEGIPVLGLCLGAQLIARAFGQKVYRFGGLEVGYPPIFLTDIGRIDPLLHGMAPEQYVMQMHEDTFDLPDDAVLLAQNDACQNQAFRIGSSTYGIQAHPEVTAKDARNFPRDCWPAMTRHFGDEAVAVEQRVIAEIDTFFESGAAFCRAVARRWLDLVVARRDERNLTGSSRAEIGQSDRPALMLS